MAEIEFEHATTGSTQSSGDGSVSVEFAQLDFMWKDWANVRAGLLLVPMGFINQINEPPFYFGVHRPEVERVHYPGLADHPGHELARQQMRGFGGIVTVDLAGGGPAARVFCKSTEYFALGESLGGVESLIGYPWTMSHAAFAPEEKRSKGITEATVRLSIGIEHVDDLCGDLAQALERAVGSP